MAEYYMKFYVYQYKYGDWELPKQSERYITKLIQRLRQMKFADGASRESSNGRYILKDYEMADEYSDEPASVVVVKVGDYDARVPALKKLGFVEIEDFDDYREI